MLSAICCKEYCDKITTPWKFHSLLIYYITFLQDFLRDNKGKTNQLKSNFSEEIVIFERRGLLRWLRGHSILIINFTFLLFLFTFLLYFLIFLNNNFFQKSKRRYLFVSLKPYFKVDKLTQCYDLNNQISCHGQRLL